MSFLLSVLKYQLFIKYIIFIISILLFKYILYKSGIDIYYKPIKYYSLHNFGLSMITFIKILYPQ